MDSIFQHESARTFLLSALQEKKVHNSRFSIRKWAKNLGLKSPSILIAALNGQRTLSTRLVTFLSEELKLAPQEKHFLRALAALDAAESPDEKAILLKELNEIRATTPVSPTSQCEVRSLIE